MGYFVIAPIWQSDVYIQFQIVLNKLPALESVLSFENKFSDSLISSSVPMLFIWSLSLFFYNKIYSSKLNKENFDNLLPMINFFVTAPASFLILWISFIAGVVIYGWLHMEHTRGLWIITGIIIFGYAISLTLYNGSKVLMVETKFLSEYGKYLGSLFFLFAFIAYLWGIFGDYLRVYFFVEGGGIKSFLLQLESMASP